MSDWIDVAPAAELAPGAWRIVDADGTSIVVFNIAGEYYAIEDVCTHDGGILTGGPVQGCIITCPRHGATFDIRSGEALTAPAYEPTATFPIRIQDGMVQVKDDRWE